VFEDLFRLIQGVISPSIDFSNCLVIAVAALRKQHPMGLAPRASAGFGEHIEPVFVAVITDTVWSVVPRRMVRQGTPARRRP
jgi:hypothetical protein